jgi:hypothetical protein
MAAPCRTAPRRRQKKETDALINPEEPSGTFFPDHFVSPSPWNLLVHSMKNAKKICDASGRDAARGKRRRKIPLGKDPFLE